MWHLVQRLLALGLLIVSLPFWLLLAILIPLDSQGPFVFTQKRWGKDKKTFLLYKFRTMVKGSERLKRKYAHLNEADGPTFKIYDDPRYTRVGKFLAHTGLDEVPQLLNVLRGEMALVGPRPLPPNEAKLVPRKYQLRHSVLPGMTSDWVVKGAHDLSFSEWMRLDVHYVKHHSVLVDLAILWQTWLLVVKSLISRLVGKPLRVNNA